MSWALTITPEPGALRLRLVGGEARMTPDDARAIAARILLIAEQAEASAIENRSTGDAARCANGCERPVTLAGLCDGCIHA